MKKWIPLFLFTLLTSFTMDKYIAGVDVFGTDRITPEELSKNESLGRCFQALLADQEETYAEIKEGLCSALQQEYGFAFTDLSSVTYFKGEKWPIYCTLDVVEEKDKHVRLQFLPPPEGTYEDPDGLLKEWENYFHLGWELMQTGEIKTSNEMRCQAFHCIWGHDHPLLAPFESRFIEGVERHQKELAEIFLNDSDSSKRANAAFLLAYMKDGQALVDLLQHRMHDVDYVVRNNVLRVFAYIAHDHPELKLPLSKILISLNHPLTTDRNKAVGILHGIVKQPTLDPADREWIKREGIPILLKMKELKQPNNRDFAIEVLKILEE